MKSSAQARAARGHQEGLSATGPEEPPRQEPGRRRGRRGSRRRPRPTRSLSDQPKRQRYDRYGHAGLEGAGSRLPQRRRHHVGLQRHLRRRAVRRPLPPAPARPAARARPADEARDRLSRRPEGTTKAVDLTRHELAASARGSGARRGRSPTTCNYCGGQGQVVQSRGFFQVATTCPASAARGPRSPTLPVAEARQARRPTSRSTSRRGSRPGCGSSSAIRASRATPAHRGETSGFRSRSGSIRSSSGTATTSSARCRSASRRRPSGPKSRCRRSTDPTA